MDDPTRTVDVGPKTGIVGAPALEVVAGAARRGPVLLIKDELVIGRQEGVDLRLLADGVSRKHAKVARRRPGQYSVVDLGAKNGTFLNGQRVVDMAPLREGDRIQIGQVVLRFGVPHDKPAMPPAGGAHERLSARELQVAELVAQGLTNAAIGQQLGITRRTVATHLEHAYERLGIHSRAELTRLLMADRV